MANPLARSIVVILALALLPGVCLAWGTLTDLLPMTRHESEQLQTLIKWYGVRTSQSLDEIQPRRGPHPTHQFIVKQAYMLLEKDPAYKDSPWKLPELTSVLNWDGIVRETGAGGRLSGMWERTSEGTGVAAPLAPAKDKIGGPSADAEITESGEWNPDYVAEYHYYNPWLKHGKAPEATGQCWGNLVKAMITGGDENAKAKAASHMGHYLTDAICPKHADMIGIKEDDLKELSGLADEWFAEHERTPTLTLPKWLESRRLDEALEIVIKASGAPRKSPYWRRVESNIGNRALLKPNTSWVRYTVDIGEPTLRNSVAGFLAALHERPPDKDLFRFYGFFDPFYYNGQLVMTYEKRGDWIARSIPQFGLVTAASEHLMWETNPAIGRYIATNVNKPIRGTRLDLSYVPLPFSADLLSTMQKKRHEAGMKAVSELVKKASLEQHGRSPSDDSGFRLESFEGALSKSVQYLFSALRASITAIRCDATYAYFPQEKQYRIYCDVGNVADETLQLKALRVSIARDGTLYSGSKWVKNISRSVAKDGRQRVILEISDERITESNPKFFVDVHGRYNETPDLGFWRGEVSERPARIIHGMSLPDFDRVKGALDLIICFDVTGSMGSSIHSVRENAITVLGQLKARIGDMRVALVSFRDVKDKDHQAFSVTPFSSNIEKVVATMRGWKAAGGGDIPEDQLQAIRLGLDLWGKAPPDSRKPTKIVVVITDAPPHDPDSFGNTQASIADYAERVDPAHIYPIIVGHDRLAHAKAAELARMTGGEVLTAKSGEEVASVFAAAVERAIMTHGETGAAPIPPSVMFYGGSILSAVGLLWFRWSLG